MTELIKQFECGKCGNPDIQIDVNCTLWGVRCSKCSYVHEFKKQKEFACDTLTLNVNAVIAKEFSTENYMETVGDFP